MKKQRFNKIVSDLAANKAFFMSFVRHPSVISVDGIRNLMNELKEVKQSREYNEMVRVSMKKTEEVVELKRKRQQARLMLERGRHDYWRKAGRSRFDSDAFG